MSQLEEANQILERMVIPTEDKRWYILTDGQGKYIQDTTHKQQVYICQEMSKEAGERYTVMPIQNAYNLIRYEYSPFRTHTEHEFRWHARERVLHNRELLLSSGHCIPDPEVRVIDDELEYDLQRDKAIRVRIDKMSASITLVNAGILKKPRPGYQRADVRFDADGLASVCSGWFTASAAMAADNIEKGFIIFYTCTPSRRADTAAYIKISQF
jgi:hypothetical protein